VTTLQERSNLAYMRYRGGVDALLNALDADRDLFDSEVGLAQTRRNELLVLVQLYGHWVGAGSSRAIVTGATRSHPWK
jgi:outer membrane protein TolC